ncbi:MAG: tetratricopeptide repeat protein [Gammaproteobacteria bacterium]
MSLINQVLQDLQQRRAPEFDTAQATLRDVTVTPARHTVRRALPPGLLWILVALLAGISIALLWQRLPTQHVIANKTAPASASTKTHATAPTQIAAAPAKPVSITASAAAAPVAKPPAPAIPTTTAVTAPPATPVASVMPVTTAAPLTPAAPAQAATTLAAAAAAPTAPAAPPTSQQPAAIAPAVVTPPQHADIPATPRKQSAPPVLSRDTTSPVEKTLRPMSAEQQAELAYRDGMRLLQSGRPSIAEPRLRAALSASPTYYPARAALAALLINSNRLADAHSLLVAGLELAPQQPTLAKLDGRLLIEQAQLQQARAVLERAAPPLPSDPEYYSLLGALYQRLGLYAQAAQTYRSIVETDPRNGVWWMGLGMALEGTGDTGAARAAYEHAQQSGSLNRAVLQFVQAKLAALQ